MDMRVIRGNIESGQAVRAKPAVAMVEGEVALPGGLREETRVLHTDALLALEGGELSGGRVTVRGRVTFHTLYTQGDKTRVQAIETAADFTHALALTGDAPQGARAQVGGEVRASSARAFNGRLLVSAEVALTGEAEAAQQVSVVSDIEGEQVKTRGKTLQLAVCVGTGANQQLEKATFDLPEALQVSSTLYATAEARAGDVLGGADGRATVEGTLYIEAYHASDMPGRPLVVTRHEAAVSIPVTLSGELGDQLLPELTVRDVAAVSQESGEGQSLRAEIMVEAALKAVRASEETVLVDAYTTQGDALTLTGREARYPAAVISGEPAESGKKLLLFPQEAPDVKTVLAAFVRPIIAGAKRVPGGKLSVDGVLEATVLYIPKDSGEPVAISQEEPFRAVFSTDAGEDDALSLTASQVDGTALTGDRVELKYILTLKTRGTRTESAYMVTDIAPVAAPELQPGIALYYLQPGESLWDVAKRYRVPEETVRTLNPDAQDAKAGARLLVYRKA